jgi:hypothetical protein
MPLQIRRGTEVERENMAQPLAQGELLYTTDNRILYVGDGTTLGGVQITGYRDEDAQDAAAAIFTNGIHSGINFVYNDLSNRIDATVDLSNYTGTLKADSFKGSVVGDDSTILVDALSGTFNGNLSGNVTGTILTAAQPNITSIGTLTSLAVTGAVTGTSFTGDVVTSLISSADSSAIRVDTPVVFETAVFIEDNLQVLGRGIFNEEVIHQTNLSNDRILTISQHHSESVNSSTLTLRRSRGSLSFELDVQSGDALGSILSTARVSSGYVPSTAIISKVEGTITSTAAPGRLEFYTVDSSGVLNDRVSIDSVGLVTIRGGLAITTDLYSSDPFVNFSQYHATADARNIVFSRARGTNSAPVAVNNNDDIIDFQFAAFDGVQFVTPCAIQVTVDAAPNTSNGANSTPGRLEFITNNGAGLATRVRIDSDGMLEALFGLEVTGQVDFITVAQPTVGAAGAASALPATPSTYFKIKVNGTEYVVPAYAVS